MYSKQECRDGLSGFPEGSPEVMEWNDCLLLTAPLRKRHDEEFSDSTHVLLERR